MLKVDSMDREIWVFHFEHVVESGNPLVDWPNQSWKCGRVEIPLRLAVQTHKRDEHTVSWIKDVAHTHGARHWLGKSQTSYLSFT